MTNLDLYAKIEPYLDLEEATYTLHKEFMRFIMENSLDNLLDIGCGRGYFLENLRINGLNYLGIDNSLEQIKVCKDKSLNAENLELKEIDQILEYCSKDTWELSVANLLKFFSWEFEDYNQ